MKFSQMFLVCVVVLLGCSDNGTSVSEWPPKKSAAIQKLDNNPELFKDIVSRMRRSEFGFISVDRDDGVYGIPDGASIDDRVRVQDASVWIDFANELKLYGFVIDDNEAVYLTDFDDPYESSENRQGSMNYAFDLNTQYKECLPEHQTIACGKCAVNIRGGWYIYYEWRPFDYAPNIEPLKMSASPNDLIGRIERTKYFDMINKAADQCLIEGYEQIGYDMTRLREYLDEQNTK